MLSVNHHISWWLFGLVSLRDLVIVLGAWWYHKQLGPFEMQPSRISKANTFFQIAFVVSLLVTLGLFSLPNWVIQSLEITVYCTTLVSGLHYVILWGGRYRRNKPKQGS
jgi:cardiolipin synthase